MFWWPDFTIYSPPVTWWGHLVTSYHVHVTTSKLQPGEAINRGSFSWHFVNSGIRAVRPKRWRIDKRYNVHQGYLLRSWKTLWWVLQLQVSALRDGQNTTSALRISLSTMPWKCTVWAHDTPMQPLSTLLHSHTSSWSSSALRTQVSPESVWSLCRHWTSW